jgi:hypothetical protein
LAVHSAESSCPPTGLDERSTKVGVKKVGVKKVGVKKVGVKIDVKIRNTRAKAQTQNSGTRR